jgi:hypothetical protein
MGYEQRIYVGEPSPYPCPSIDGNKTWFQVFGMIDLCKVGGGLVTDDVVKACKPVFIFGSDGDTKIEKDCYGTELVAVPIGYVIDALKEINAREKYSRTKWAYDMLVSMSKKRKGYHGMTATHCIIFGH